VYDLPEETGFDIEKAFPSVHAWHQRLAAPPGWKQPYELMPAGSRLLVRMA
jgi:hypothetical protein